jgi:hypothetical protein
VSAEWLIVPVFYFFGPAPKFHKLAVYALEAGKIARRFFRRGNFIS